MYISTLSIISVRCPLTPEALSVVVHLGRAPPAEGAPVLAGASFVLVVVVVVEVEVVVVVVVVEVEVVIVVVVVVS